MASETTLPEYSHPPVAEVALSVQFEPIVKMRLSHLGILWQHYRDRFPVSEEHPALESAFERFGQLHTAKTMHRIEIHSRPPLPRCWFLDQSRTKLIQVQNDRFIYNWRRVDNSNEYPRYHKILDEFKREFKIFSTFLKEEELGEMSFNQCEVTYLNHIVTNEQWSNHSQLHKVLTLLTNQYNDRFLPDLEDGQVTMKYIMTGTGDDKDKSIGRLHVALESVFRLPDMQPIFVLTLTARGIPLGDGLEGAVRFLDTGREWIVKAFASITTSEMQAVWGKKS